MSKALDIMTSILSGIVLVVLMAVFINAMIGGIQ